MRTFRRLRGDADAEEGWTWRWRVIGFGAGGLVALAAGLAFFVWNSGDDQPQQETARPADVMFAEPEREYRPPPQPEPAVTPASMPMMAPASVPSQQAKPGGRSPEQKPDPIADAQTAEIGEWVPQGQDAQASLAPSMNVSFYDDAACTVPSGSAIKAELISAAITSNASVVKAMVTNDILCTNGDRGIIAGAVLVGQAQQGADFGSERMDLVFTTLQQGEMEIDLAGVSSGDGMGKGGHPGEVDRHAGQTALRVAVATAVDVAIASAGGGIWGPLVGTPSRAVDDWARQALGRDPVITIDGSQNRIPITIITQKSIAL